MDYPKKDGGEEYGRRKARRELEEEAEERVAAGEGVRGGRRIDGGVGETTLRGPNFSQSNEDSRLVRKSGDKFQSSAFACSRKTIEIDVPWTRFAWIGLPTVQEGTRGIGGRGEAAREA